MAWTEEQKTSVVEAYLAEEPTPDTIEEIVQMFSDDTQDDDEPRSVNAIRRILTNAEVYVKKEPAKAASKKSGGEKKPRVTPKAKALANFVAICELNGAEFSLDEEDTKKITAKVLEAIIDLVGQVGTPLPDVEED